MFRTICIMSLFAVFWFGCGGGDVSPSVGEEWCGETTCEPESSGVNSQPEEDKTTALPESQRELTPCQMLDEESCEQDPEMGCRLLSPKEIVWNPVSEVCVETDDLAPYCVESGANAVETTYYSTDEDGELDVAVWLDSSYPPPPTGDWMSCSGSPEEPEICRCP